MKDAKLATETRLHPRGDMRQHRVDISMITIENRALITTITGHLHPIICEGMGKWIICEGTRTLLWEESTSRTYRISTALAPPTPEDMHAVGLITLADDTAGTDDLATTITIDDDV